MGEKDNKRDRGDKLLQTYSALGIGFVCIIIGLPLWWKTTDVYRVSLPYNTIAELDGTEVGILVKFEVVTLSSNARFDEKLNSELDTYVNVIAETHPFIHVKYKFNIRKPTKDEEFILSADSQNILELESRLSQTSGNALINGNYRFYIISSQSFGHLEPSKNVILGLTRNVFVKSSSVENVSRAIGKLLKNILLREQDLSDVFLATKRTDQMKPNKDSMRSLRSFIGYDIIFTLMNPQPDMVSVHWSIQNAIERYLDPLISSLAEYADIFVRSQYIHLTGINAQAKHSPEQGCYVLPMAKLPHIINPIEPYLASHVTNNPTLNFVVYVPTRDQTPLKIFDQAGKPSITNSFLVPRWGGLLIYNVDTPASKNNSTSEFPFKTEIDSKKIFSVFLSQLKSLLGFRKVSDESVQIFRSGSKVIADWELDAWLFERSVENVGKSSSTLNSLSQLLKHISNIVINDGVAERVNTAVTSTQRSFDLMTGARLKESFLHSRRALNSSEKAFFDPSLLELLYFPEDQKFAIYIPLFLPIGIPVLNSIFHAIRYLKNKDKQPKEN